MKEITKSLKELEEGLDCSIEIVWYTDGSGIIRNWNGSKSIYIFDSEEELLEYLIKQTS